MNKIIKNLLILICIIIIIGFVFLAYQPNADQERDEDLLLQDYPKNLIEGIVEAVDSEEMTFKIKARTSLIQGAEEQIMEKTIILTQDTECEIYYINTKRKDVCDSRDIGLDDDVVIVTLESTLDNVNKLDEFTAVKVTKMIGE